MPMKVLIYTEEYYPTCAACAYRMQIFADAFAARGHQVTVLTSARNKDGAAQGERKEKILYSPAIRMRKKTTLMRLLNNLSFGFFSLFTALRAGGADVVIVTSPPPLSSPFGRIIARCKRALLIYDVRDIWPDVALEMGSFSPDSAYCRVFRRIADKMYRKSDWISTVSPGKVEKLRGYVKALDGGKNPSAGDKVKFVGNGFDEGILRDPVDPAVAARYGMNEGFNCVYIGNIGLAQGLDALLDIAANTKREDARFLLFGTGAEKDKLEERVRREGLKNVRFCGVLPHNEVHSVLDQAQLSFIPLKSAAMKDSIPTKVYEALGIGCPVLLMAEGDSCQIVEASGLGKCVSPDHPESLAQTFDDMADHYDLYARNRDKARKMMLEEYSRQRIAARFAAETEEYVKKGKKKQ